MEGVGITGTDFRGAPPLMLVLSQLIVVIRYLKPTPRGEQVEVEDISAAGHIIEAVEDGLVVSCVVDGDELRGVQKAPGLKAVDGHEVPEFRRAIPESDTSAGRAKRPVVGIDVAKDSAGAEPRPG